jgi:hypothetical protein
MSDDELLLPCLLDALDLAGGTHELADVARALAEGRAQYWTNGGAAIVTEIIQYPQLRAVNYWLVGGELRAALALAPKIEDWARERNCVRAVALGRKGWTPHLCDLGWTAPATGFRKELLS